MINWTKSFQRGRHHGYLGDINLLLDPFCIVQKCAEKCWTVEIEDSGNADGVFPTMKEAKAWAETRVKGQQT